MTSLLNSAFCIIFAATFNAVHAGLGLKYASGTVYLGFVPPKSFNLKSFTAWFILLLFIFWFLETELYLYTDIHK